MSAGRDELQVQVADRKRALIRELIEHKKNSSRFGALEAIEKISHHLLDLARILNAGSWSKLTPGARLRLTEWVAR